MVQNKYMTIYDNVRCESSCSTTRVKNSEIIYDFYWHIYHILYLFYLYCYDIKKNCLKKTRQSLI